MIEITHGWRNVIAHSSTQQHLDTILLNDLIAGGIVRRESRQACHFSAVHLQKRRAILDQKGWKPQIVPYVHHKWHADTIDDIDMVKAQDMGPEFYHSFVQFVIWETFQQSVLQSLDTIKRSCTKDDQKSQRTGNPSGFPRNRVTDCLAQTNNKRGSISSRTVLIATSSTKGRA